MLSANETTTNNYTQIVAIFSNVEPVICGVYEIYFSDNKPIFCWIDGVKNEINCTWNEVSDPVLKIYQFPSDFIPDYISDLDSEGWTWTYTLNSDWSHCGWWSFGKCKNDSGGWVLWNALRNKNCR